jgi:hypothetical protein
VFAQPFDAFSLLTANYLPIHAVLFARAVVHAGCRMDETLDYFEDWDFWLQLSAHGRFQQAPGISAYYRQGGESDAGLTPSRHRDDRRAGLYRSGVERVLERALARTEIATLHRLLARTRERLSEAQGVERALSDKAAELSAVRQQLDGVREALDAAEHDRQRLEARSALLDRVQASTSWRLTAPYRWVVRQLNRVGIG